MGAREGCAAGAHPSMACPALLALEAPGCSLFLMSLAATWGGSFRKAAFINSCQVPPCKSVKQHLPEPISHEGRGSSHHVPSSSDHEASNSGLHPFSRLRDLHFCLITLIPECLSNTRDFPSPGQPFILPTCSFLSPLCSTDETPC